jgi:hypothetical protein
MSVVRNAVPWMLVLVCAMPSVADENGKEERKPGWKAGADIYFGLSNLTGPTRRLTDRQWAAVETYEPSVVYVEWAGAAGDDARLSLGVGDVYTGSDRITRQPVECLWKRPVGTTTVTLGKHYTPFAIQEWEYETRWGAMAETEAGPFSVSLSLTHNPDTHAVNSILRVARKAGAHLEIGVSAAAGRGWSYATSHSKGYGLDAVAQLGAVTLSTEGLVAEGPNGRYTFGFVKAETEARPGWRPYIGAYYGHDTADEMGELRSAALGIEIDATPNLMLEPGVGRASGRNVWWLTANIKF